MRRRNWVVLALAPALLSGCGVIESFTGGGAAGSAGAGGTGGTAPSWVVVQQGTPAPSAKPSAGPSPSPLPSGFLPLTPVAPRTGGTPVSSCPPSFFKFSKIGGAQVVAGPTSAVVTWNNIGGANLVEFRITAIDQDLIVGDQIDVGWTTVKPTGCGQISATVTGLQRRTAYVFSVDAVVERRSGDGTHAATIARSSVTRTT